MEGLRMKRQAPHTSETVLVYRAHRHADSRRIPRAHLVHLKIVAKGPSPTEVENLAQPEGKQALLRGRAPHTGDA